MGGRGGWGGVGGQECNCAWAIISTGWWLGCPGSLACRRVITQHSVAQWTARAAPQPHPLKKHAATVPLGGRRRALCLCTLLAAPWRRPPLFPPAHPPAHPVQGKGAVRGLCRGQGVRYRGQGVRHRGHARTRNRRTLPRRFAVFGFLASYLMPPVPLHRVAASVPDGGASEFGAT